MSYFLYFPDPDVIGSPYTSVTLIILEFRKAKRFYLVQSKLIDNKFPCIIYMFIFQIPHGQNEGINSSGQSLFESRQIVNLESDLSSQPSVESMNDLLDASFETLTKMACLNDHDKLIYHN